MQRLLITLALVLALACTWFFSPPASADTLYVVSGVHVDASAASASEAQLAALAQGRPRAWQTLFRRLVRQQDWDKQPNLDDPTLQRLITNFQVSHERRSTTRYVADLTFIFNPDAVARTLRTALIPYTQVQAKRILLVPMAPTYVRSSNWTAAFANPGFMSSAVPFSLPAGDPATLATLAGVGFDAATWSDVDAVASRIHATEAALVLAIPDAGHITVWIRRIGLGQVPQKTSVAIPYQQGGVQATYPAAADAAVRAVEEMWKTRAAVDFSQKGKLNAYVRISSLTQWGSVQSALANVPNVAATNLVAMNIGEAEISLSYLGTTDQLRDALSAQGLALSNRGGDWFLAQGAPASASPP